MSKTRLALGLVLLSIGLVMMNVENLRPVMNALLTTRDIATARSWCDQLSGIDLSVLQRLSCDVLVIDPDEARTSYRASSLSGLRFDPSGYRRNVFAYLSIGEAEGHRSYWDQQWLSTPPPWIVAPDPDWPGSFRVRFWHDDWQAIVYRRLDDVLEAGFDGAFFDNVDSYQERTSENRDAASQMIEFVGGLSRRAASKRPEFKIVVQNAEELLRSAQYANAIHGIAKESLLFGTQGEGVRNSTESIKYSVGLLNIARGQGKPVFILEYITPGLVDEAQNEIREYGFIPFFAQRLLDRPTRFHEHHGNLPTNGCAGSRC